MGQSVNISIKLSLPTNSLIKARSALNGEMNADSTIVPASNIKLATSPIRLIFSLRPASSNARSLFNPWRTLSPSNRYVLKPLSKSFFSRATAKVDLPDPESPVNQMSCDFWFNNCSRSCLFTLVCWVCRFEGFKLQVSGFKFQVASCRLPVAGFIIGSTKQ